MIEELSEHSEISVLVIVERDSVAVEPDESVELLVRESACHHQGVEARELDSSGVSDVDRVDSEYLDCALAFFIVLYGDKLDHCIILIGDEALGGDIEADVGGFSCDAAEGVGCLELLVVMENRIPAVCEIPVAFLEVDERTELTALVGILVDETVDQVSFLGSDSCECGSVVRDSPAEGFRRFLVPSCLKHEPGLSCHVAFLLTDTDVSVAQEAEITILLQCSFSSHWTLRKVFSRY